MSSPQEDDSTDGLTGARRGRRLRPAMLAAGIFVGAIMTAGLLLAVVGFLRTLSDRLPMLTQETYEEALAHWKQYGPADYDLDLAVEGRRAGVIHIEVRGGEATLMTRDGVTPREQRTWYFWTVPGQLETIGEELDKVADPVAGFQAPVGSRVVIQAVFDSRFGYPLRYRRTIPGTEFDIEWKTTRFIPH